MFKNSGLASPSNYRTNEYAAEAMSGGNTWTLHKNVPEVRSNSQLVDAEGIKGEPIVNTVFGDR